MIASGMLVEKEHPRTGRLRNPEHGHPLQPHLPGVIRIPAPAPGEHTDVVRAEAGLELAEVARLRSNRVIF